MNKQPDPSNPSELDETKAFNVPMVESVEDDSDEMTEETFADLVAYLDGELAAEEVTEVEQRLARDDAYRDRLRQLQHSWDLLESLPRTSINDDFTRSTVELVALSIGAQVEQRRGQSWWVQRMRWGVAGIIVAVFALAGFGVAYERLTRDQRQLLRDLPVIERVDLYREVNSIEFLEKLASEGLFDEEKADAP
ncbi:MAG: hypothetical protein VXY07_03120 [Planctomycetota bacterium]|jgi:anti-sigma-K factor RskA|nr:hypothetical protein [Planctomycetota bacterium]MEC7450791.1 hypothetical protein [Planctomycetota bacterium]MEC7496671.1 hypothetical protein [Planctomycetota bacterium]MEC7720007.1 hypothetical protein [Planctomycetota bacterium]MEC8781796.1 hypothetical protein [Planctomycetota bacterium]